jgi:phage tail-like protein
MAIEQNTVSSFLTLLPSIFSDDPAHFLGRFLLAFEHVLTGLAGLDGAGTTQADAIGEAADTDSDLGIDGLEETIAGISTLFDARETPEEFLPWLAGWVALGLRADWTVAQKRDFLAKIVPLYRRRGTKENLADLLKIYTGLTPVITGAEDTECQIGVHSTIGKDMQLGGAPAHRFHVSVTMPNPDPETLQRQFQIASALIDLQKPAHTTYELEIVFNTMQLGVRSTIGRDTLLGSVPVA